MNLHISVKQEHIDKGIPMNSDSCPLYYAVEEALLEQHKGIIPLDLFVGLLYPICFFSERDNSYFVLDHDDKEILDFIRAFDNGDNVKPFELDIVLTELDDIP